MSVKRVPNNRSAIDNGVATSIECNQYAGAKKVLNVGPQFQILGPIGSAVAIHPGASIAVFNTSNNTVNFIKISNDGSAPTGLADGIPVAPQAWLYVNIPLGMNAIRSNSANVGAYLIVDDTQLSDTTNQ